MGGGIECWNKCVRTKLHVSNMIGDIGMIFKSVQFFNCVIRLHDCKKYFFPNIYTLGTICWVITDDSHYNIR